MTGNDDHATLGFARAIVAEERAEELPLFDAQGAMLLERVRAGERAARRPDSHMGFGENTATIALVTPVVVVLVDVAIALLKEAARSAATDFLKETILDRLRWAAGSEVRAPEKDLHESLKAELRAALKAEMAERFPGAETHALVEAVMRRVGGGDGDDLPNA